MKRQATATRRQSIRKWGWSRIRPAPAPAAATDLGLGAEVLETRMMLSGPNPNELIDVSLTPTELAQSLVGAGVTVENATLSGGNAATGSFVFNDPTVLGFGQGIVLTSGSAADVVGPNLSDWNSTDYGLPGDSNLTDLSGFTTFDAAVLEFDFTPSANQVVFNYVFASDEYPEWVNTPFNDVFAFYVNGVNHAVVRQVAGDPTAAFVPVAVNNINQGNPLDPGFVPTRPDLFRPNYFNPNGGPSAFDLELDGVTSVLTFQAPVNPGVVNHMKLAIADASDGIYDSAVFIQAGSLVSNENPVADLSVSPESGAAPLVVSAYLEGEDPNGAPLTYTINWGDGTSTVSGPLNLPVDDNEKTAVVEHVYSTAGDYLVTLTISNGTALGVSVEDVHVSGTIVVGAPQITTQPSDQFVADGGFFAFQATAIGNPTPSVQWQVSTDGGATFVDIPGATQNTYSGVADLTNDGNWYQAVFSNSEGSVTTAAAQLVISTVEVAPSVVSDPTDLIVADGDLYTFTAVANGVPLPDVQWQVSTDSGATFTDIPGATSTTLSGLASAADDGNRYRAVFSNSLGTAISAEAELIVTSIEVAPVITGQPLDQSVAAGEVFQFTASATGLPAPSVQWQVSTDGGESFSDIPGATSPTLSGVASLADNGNYYQAEFTNSEDSVTTVAALLTVTVPVDHDPPVAPGVSLANDTGASDSDRVTADGSLILAGIEPGATVEYQAVGGSGWTTSFLATEGKNTLQVRQTDAAGNVGPATIFSFTLDTTLPAAPTVALGADTGSDSADLLTREGWLTLGNVEPAAAAEYSTDGGNVWGPGFVPIEGLNSIAVRINDLAGNTGPVTVFAYTLDTTGPSLAPTFSSAPPFLVGAAGISLAVHASDLHGIADESSGAVDTSTAGAKTVLCAATDRAGNVSSVHVPYVVGYAIVNATPASGTTIKRWSPATVAFQLADAFGVIAPATAQALLPNVQIELGGWVSSAVKCNAKTGTFSAKLKITSLPAGNYDLTIRVRDGGTDLATLVVPLILV